MEDIIVKVAAAIVALATLHYLYRIICPKQKDLQKSDKTPANDNETVPSVMGKSRFVLPDRSKPLPFSAIIEYLKISCNTFAEKFDRI